MLSLHILAITAVITLLLHSAAGYAQETSAIKTRSVLLECSRLFKAKALALPHKRHQYTPIQWPHLNDGATKPC